MDKVARAVRTQLHKEINQERDRQVQKHGKGADNHTPERWLVILSEEVGEVSHAVLEHNLENYHDELIQVAAVAFAALEDLCLKLARDKKR